jgi:transposase InsO family protein
LRDHHLHTKARRQQLAQPVGGATKSFEAPFVNDLWMADFSPGPFLAGGPHGKALATWLCVLIDDHSRLIPYAAYYLRADTHSFRQTLKEALRRRGVPTKLYTDQGQPFTCDHNQLYEVDLSLRTLPVELRFDPAHPDHVEVTYRGTRFGLAKPVDPHLNSQIQAATVYEKRPQS